MTIPRRITLITVPGLRALHREIAAACAPEVAAARATAVLVPTRSAAAQLRRTLESLWLARADVAPSPTVVFPDILARGEWYRRLHEGSAHPALLSEIEREVLLGAAARDAIEGGAVPPFRMRPGLVAEMLAFYDSLRRQQKTVADFERVVVEDLEPRAEFDRGAERLLRQTRFLVATFHAFESRVASSGALDEHTLRERLLDAADRAPVFRRLVVTVGDRAAEPSAGLYPADLDLLTRLPGLEAIDLIATRAVVLAGLGERLRDLLPGLEERTVEESEPSPVLVQPAGSERPYFLSRDREEELRDVARRTKQALRSAPAGLATAVVFRRPLPYVYLGSTVFEAAGIEYQTADALPLAAEPFAAALDLIFSAVAARFARGPLLQLMRSPHFVFAGGGDAPGHAALAALDRALAEAGYLGDLERLRAFAEQAAGPAARAAAVAAGLASELAPLAHPASVSSHLTTLLGFVREHERLPVGDDPVSARHLRARAAVLRTLEDLRAAALRFDDPPATLTQLAPSIRRWLESQTFSPARGEAGVELVDASAARYGHFDQVHLAGLVAGDWPEAAARNIFYPTFLLGRLGWPSDSARLGAERAAFLDLLRLARQRVSVSSFTLEDDSIVEVSPLLEDLEHCGLAAAPEAGAAGPKAGLAAKGGASRVRVFADEALMGPSPTDAPLAECAATWLALRQNRAPKADPRFHGFTRPTPDASPPSERGDGRRAARGYTVTGLDRYLECPFKYFARSVLELPEEAAEEHGMTPRERGRFVHEVFRAFFSEWHASGGREIGLDQLEAARSLFARLVETALASLPAGEACIERMRLLGTVAAPGLGEIVLAAEAERPGVVVNRLLEYPFEGEFTLTAGGTSRALRLRGKADRVDLLADGRLRLIDYKIGRAPDESIQLPVYALCLQQQFARDGRRVEIGEAFYVAFGQRARPIEVVLDGVAKGDSALDQAQERVLAAVEGIERGDFPPRPAAPRLCGVCAYAALCRKDYVGAD